MGLFGWFARKEQNEVEPFARRSEPQAPVPEAAGWQEDLALAGRKLRSGDNPGALEGYRALLSDDSPPELLTALSGDLGAAGCLEEMIELLAPVYLPERHGPLPGLNLLQAHLRLQRVDAAEHLLNLLFALDDPELRERLYGFGNAVEELKADLKKLRGPRQLSTVTVSRPLWYYGLEEPAWLLPPAKQAPRVLVLAAPSVLVGEVASEEEGQAEVRELGRLGRAITLFLAESFLFRQGYAPVALFPLDPESGLLELTAEMSRDHVGQIAASLEGPCHFVISGTVGRNGVKLELGLRVWDEKLRQRKSFGVRCVEAELDQALGELTSQLLTYMEAGEPCPGPGTWTTPGSPCAYGRALESYLWHFLAGKNCLPESLVVNGWDAALKMAAGACGAKADETAPAPESLLLLASLFQNFRSGREEYQEYAALARERLGGAPFGPLTRLLGRMYGGDVPVMGGAPSGHSEWLERVTRPGHPG